MTSDLESQLTSRDSQISSLQSDLTSLQVELVACVCKYVCMSGSVCVCTCMYNVCVCACEMDHVLHRQPSKSLKNS